LVRPFWLIPASPPEYDVALERNLLPKSNFMALLLQQRNRWEQERTKWRNWPLKIHGLPTWLGHFGWVQAARYPLMQFSFYAVKVLANLDCYIILRLHNIDGQSTIPQLCSSLDGKALFLERPTAVVYSSMPSFLPK
jgi:hypothetical protein